MKRRTLTVTAAAAAAAAAGLPRAAIRPARGRVGAVSNGVVKIGVLDDMSGVFADQQGMGDVISTRLAAENFGGRVLGAPIELVFGGLQNRADVGMAIARRWYDQERVDAIVGFGNSAVAPAVQRLRREADRIDIAVAAGTTDLTRRACSPLGVHWTYDNHALSRGTGAERDRGHPGAGRRARGRRPRPARRDRLLLAPDPRRAVRRAGRGHRRGRHATRAFARRFARVHGRPPTMFQASMWGAVTHGLEAVQPAGADAAEPVMAKMREPPINDFMTRDGRPREDGRVPRGMDLMCARRPGEARGGWGLQEVVATIPGDEPSVRSPEASARWCVAPPRRAAPRRRRLVVAAAVRTHPRSDWHGGSCRRCAIAPCGGIMFAIYRGMIGAKWHDSRYGCLFHANVRRGGDGFRASHGRTAGTS